MFDYLLKKFFYRKYYSRIVSKILFRIRVNAPPDLNKLDDLWSYMQEDMVKWMIRYRSNDYELWFKKMCGKIITHWLIENLGIQKATSLLLDIVPKKVIADHRWCTSVEAKSDIWSVPSFYSLLGDEAAVVDWSCNFMGFWLLELAEKPKSKGS